MAPRKSSRAARQRDKLRKQKQRTKVDGSFVYLPTTSKWKEDIIRKFQIPMHLPSLQQEGISSTQLIPVSNVPPKDSLLIPLTQPSAVHNITPDGNCLFNALSYVLTGSENYQGRLRLEICNFLRTYPADCVSILPPSANRDVQTYLTNSHMEDNGTWGTEVELLSASVLLQTNIFVYTKSGVHWKWIKYAPFNLELNHGIYLYHANGSHFDVVVATQNSDILPYLQPEDYCKVDQKKSRYHTDDAFREKRKKEARQCMNKRYRLEKDFRQAKLEKERLKYAFSNSFADLKKEQAKKRYRDNSSVSNSKRLASVTRYCVNTYFRNRLQKLSKHKYLHNMAHRKNLKDYSKTKYVQNALHREKKKEHSKAKYANDALHRQKKKEQSKTKYAQDDHHKQRVKDYSKTKYAQDDLHRQRVKDYSKTKYRENIAYRERMKTYSKAKYHRFSSFRNCLKSSSIKKYAKNPLFRIALQLSLKKKYHHSSIVRDKKKKEVRTSRLSITKSIQRFKKSVQTIPTYICTVCVRLLYRKQVKKCKRQRYFVDDELNEKASQCLNYSHNFKDHNKDDWICDTCDRHLKAGHMPPQAVANNLDLVPIPVELSSLNELERQLISLRIPFLKMLSLPRGGQKGVKGPIVNVPSDVSSITSLLPRNINDAQLIKVKLKRKLSYKGYYKYKWINPHKVIQALKLLIVDNLWFENIKVDDSWLQNIDDSELVKESDDTDSESDSENPIESDNSFELPVETCFEPVDIGQDILDTSKTLCVAPAENEKPQNIFQENGSDAMAFPTLLPDGHFGLFENREIKLSPSKYFNARLFSADCRFSSNKEFIFFAQYVTEINQISSNISLAIRKGKHTTVDGNPVTASMLLDSDHISNILKSDIGYRFLQPVRGTPPYWQRTMKDLYAMLHQLGIPTWFVTFSAAEMRWDEVIQTLLFLNNDERQVKDVEWSERCSLVTNNPVMTARMFDHRVKALFSEILMSPSCPVGKVEDYFFRTEFQQRGSPHIHCLLWIQNAPKFNENTDAEVCNFIDQYITCKMPNIDKDPELHDIISSVQIHSKNHSKSCKKYSTTCRFNFPRPPVCKTFIARSESFKEKPNKNAVPTVEELDQMSKESARKPREILRDIWMLVSSADESDFSLHRILQLVNVTYAQYKQCLIDVSTRNTVHLKRQLSDVWVNNYNQDLSRAWNANLDIQFVTDSYACVAYILSYISKAETEIGDLLRNAQQEADEGNKDATSAMRKIGNTYVQNREVSAQEAVYRVCGLHLKDCSREVVFIPAGSNIVKMSLPMSLIKSRSSQGEENEQNIWMTSVHDRYHARPKSREFNEMCMAEFCSKFRYIPKSQTPKSSELLPVFELSNGLGHIKKRKPGKEAVIRYPRFSLDKSPEEYYLALLQLFLPHRSDIELPAETENFESYVKFGSTNSTQILEIIERNKHHFEKDSENLEKAWSDIQDGKIPDESWGALDPETEVERIEIEMEHVPEEIEEPEIIPELFCESKSDEHKPSVHYEPPTVSQKAIHEAIRTMNETQQEIFYQIRDWCQHLVWGKNPQPFFVFLTGGAGTGKSHLIRCIYHEMTRILSKHTASPDSTSILLTAPTGTAAFNIQGMTIHSAFAINKNVKLPYQPLGENLLNTLRSKFESMQILIIDEISMVDQKILTYVHGRLSQIKHTKKPFGNVSVLAVGDFYQLPPVRGLALHKKRDSNFTDLWNTNFSIVTLTEIMRQKDDCSFAEMLNRLRIHVRGIPLSETDKQSLKNASITQTPDNLKSVLHIFPTNKEVDAHNSKMIEQVCHPVITSLAKDFYMDLPSRQLRQKEQPYVKCAPEDLQTSVKVGIGARVMLTRNINTDDGLVNGAFGSITGIEFDSSQKVKAVYIRFDNDKIGQKHAKKLVTHPEYKGSVYIKLFQDTLCGKRVTRKQLPLKLAWASTIHKVQGMTVNQIVVSLKNIFQPGMAYVALSRATSLQGLHVLNLDIDSIYSSGDITQSLQEMPPFLSSEPSNQSINSLSIIHHNTEGLLPHLKDIMSVKKFKDAHVICLTETWLSPNQTIPSTLYPNHHTYQCLRGVAYDSSHPLYSELRTQARGGVAVFVNEVSHELMSLDITNIEAVAVKVRDKCVITMYRPPVYPLQLFIRNLKKLLRDVQLSHIPSVVIGDFNNNILQPGNNLLLQTFEEFGYTQTVNFPTTEAGTCLDLVFIHQSLQNTQTTLLPTFYSFHDAVQMAIKNT